MASSRVWHISGANTGLGLELALKALGEGDRVIAAVRTPSKVPESLQRPDVKALRFDLAWTQEEMNDYAKTAVAAFGQIDVLVNNAGFAYMGAIEESEDAEVKAQFDINVFAMLRIIRATLPHFRSRKSGIIMNLSSVGGFLGFPSNGIYCATKFAIEGITESLAAEVAPFGIHCVIVEPGYFRTAFLANPASGGNVAPALAAYEGTPAHEARKAFETINGKQPGDPVAGAARMWEYVAGEGLLSGIIVAGFGCGVERGVNIDRGIADTFQ
ncbi:related to short chain oxidoreductase/dehydrogenase [Cephalotrichum gorgonifer]|uniref:Related to short chain oxidoreductase/dehydrogenase n=1 Tax=Cephalotrichum gorgonifer TaxID=2041049 RepID=A0AAE8MUW9_9PEZI|nr:related to short chain oxidoreductase/dehydrogenase [Cephalotrichum gorgonifer]